MLAAYNLVKRFNPKKVYVNFLVELEFLKGRDLFPNDVEIESLIKYWYGLIDKNENIKNKLALLPDTPGVYQYFDKTGKIIYVGKAKNLKRRVSSYFNKVHDSPKTNILVKNIYDLQYIVVKTEEDALHLENSLIKAYKPR